MGRINRSNPIPFTAINDAARNNLTALVTRWLPDGYREGCEWVARNPCRSDHRHGSFKVHIAPGPKCGMWRDFATDDGGSDPISLAAYLFQLPQGEAARRLADMLGVRHD